MKKVLTFCIILFLWFSFAVLAQVPTKKVLTVEDCVSIALKQSFQARSAQENYQAARWELVGAWSGFLPRIDLYSSWNRYSQDILKLRLGQLISSRDLYNFNLGLTQTIFNGGANWATYNLKKAGKRLAKDDLEVAEKTIELNVKESCYNLLKAQMLYEVQKDAVKKSIEQLNMAKARYDLGSASLSDYLKAKVQLGNDSLNLISYANSVRLTEASLNSLLGLEINTPLQVDAKLEYKKLIMDFKAELKSALEKHPQIDRANQEMNQAKSSLTIARSANFPSISFFGDYSWSDIESPRSKTWEDYDSWDIGIRISMNLFEGFATTSNVRSAKARIKIAKESFKQSKRDLELEIRQAYLSVNEAEQKILLTEQALKSAEQDLKLTQEKYNLGAASMLELLDANVSYRTATNNQVQVLYDYNLAVAKYEKAVGK